MSPLVYNPEVFQLLDAYRQNILINDDLSPKHLKEWFEKKRDENPMPKGEFYNRTFPNSLSDFIHLSRPFDPDEVRLADKEILALLASSLKRKELEYYIKYHELLNKLDEKQYK